MADVMTVPEHRAALVDMARAWHQMAQVHEQAEQPDEDPNQMSTQPG